MSQQFENPRIQGYFDNLPVYLQESIRQSGIPIDTEARLCRLVQELTQERPPPLYGK